MDILSALGPIAKNCIRVRTKVKIRHISLATLNMLVHHSPSAEIFFLMAQVSSACQEKVASQVAEMR